MSATRSPEWTGLRNAARLVVLTLLVGACSGLSSVDVGGSKILFPVAAGVGGATAILNGELVLDGPCLYVDQGAGDNYLVVWPSGSTLEQRDGTLVIRQGSDEVQVGSSVSLEGGEYERAFVEDKIYAELPCNGPFWIASALTGG